MTEAAASAPGTALTVAQRASVALGAAEHERKLIELAKQSTEIVAITNPASLQQCHGARMALKTERINIEKLGKAAREDATAFSKAVIAEEKRLIAIIEPEETRLELIQRTHEAEVQRKKDEAAQAERERVERIQASIREIRGSLIDVAGRPATVIEAKIAEIVAHEITRETVQEFVDEAEAVRSQTLVKLRELHAAAVEQEAEAARLKAEREELEQLRAQQAQREREAKERAFAEEQRLEAQRREAQARIEAQEREARERLDAEERRQQAERDRLAAAARALEERQREEREAAEAKARAEREAQEARDREQRLAQEQREREARDAQELAERQERERIAAEQEAREAEEREARLAEEARQQEERLQEQARQLAAARLDAEKLEARELAEAFCERFEHLPEWASAIKALRLCLSPKAARQRKAAAIDAA
ncbi:MAG: putative phage coiled coil domain protein [bacterium]|nr:putative phage coiled coil domain protein [bacterium]